jgi:hypothetical protein
LAFAVSTTAWRVSPRLWKAVQLMVCTFREWFTYR